MAASTRLAEMSVAIARVVLLLQNTVGDFNSKGQADRDVCECRPQRQVDAASLHPDGRRSSWNGGGGSASASGAKQRLLQLLLLLQQQLLRLWRRLQQQLRMMSAKRERATQALQASNKGVKGTGFWFMMVKHRLPPAPSSTVDRQQRQHGIIAPNRTTENTHTKIDKNPTPLRLIHQH
jgi:hypothetical protein